jgi:uncharacterized protein
MPVWSPGRFVWYELFTPDIAKSKKYYQELLGWKIAESEMGSMKYTMISCGDTPIAGMMPLSTVKMEGVPPFWQAYVSVPNVDEAAAAASSNGGKVLVEPVDIPPVGRFCVIMDPQGATVIAFKAADGDPPEVERAPVGTFCWNDLYTTDPGAAATFYGKVFGWRKELFQGDANMPVFMRGKLPAAGLAKTPPGIPPHWLNYVSVANLETSRKKAVELGGKVMLEEMVVPGVGKFCVVVDNVGAGLALFQS